MFKMFVRQSQRNNCLSFPVTLQPSRKVVLPNWGTFFDLIIDIFQFQNQNDLLLPCMEVSVSDMQLQTIFVELPKSSNSISL